MTDFYTEVNITHSEQVDIKLIEAFYQAEFISDILNQCLSVMLLKLSQGLVFPYLPSVTLNDWKNIDKLIELDIYVTDLIEGKELNHNARGKNYATNILSYPSDLPAEILSVLSSIPLGELVICHEVLETQAQEQHKTVSAHLTHLLIHGVLHLLGFDHELGEDERREMEAFEIEILDKLDIENPY